MNLFGVPISFVNGIGIYSLLALFLLFLLYLMRPKPVRKTIPSLIFLEWSQNKKNLSAFFQKFVKDWLFLLQFLIIFLLCLAALGMTAQLYFSKINDNAAIVVDLSASSNAIYNNKPIFEEYRNIAKKSLGLKNTIIAIRNSPEILAKETNLINANRIISSMKPSSSLSNIWDSMMLASQFSDNIIVISDFVDTNSKDASLAKQILEAKGAKVTLINPRTEKLHNIGIVNFIVNGNKAVIEAKNFDDIDLISTVKNSGEELTFKSGESRTFEIELIPGVNKIELSDDDFSVDNSINIILPTQYKTQALFISNKKNNLFYALSSIRGVEIIKVEPPIVPISDEKLIVLSDVDYEALLPGTIEKIQERVKNGASLVVAGQRKFDSKRFLDLLPVITEEKKEEISILNNDVDKFKSFDFGLSSNYLKSTLMDNKSIVIASYFDGSPAIAYKRYGQGNIFYYGIIDDDNSFKLSTQYPLFWINVLNMVLERNSIKDINLQIGDIIYGETIKTPFGKKEKQFLIATETGIYEIGNKKISVNLLNMAESSLNLPLKYETEKTFEKKYTEQNINLLLGLAVLAIVLLLLEIWIMKKRGDM